MNVKECQAYLAIFKCSENIIMHNLCKLSKSSYPALAVVSTHPVYNHIHYNQYAHTLCPTENGVNTYFQSFLVNDLANSLANLHNNSPQYCIYPHQAGPFQVQYLLRYSRFKLGLYSQGKSHHPTWLPPLGQNKYLPPPLTQ